MTTLGAVGWRRNNGFACWNSENYYIEETANDRTDREQCYVWRQVYKFHCSLSIFPGGKPHTIEAREHSLASIVWFTTED